MTEKGKKEGKEGLADTPKKKAAWGLLIFGILCLVILIGWALQSASHKTGETGVNEPQVIKLPEATEVTSSTVSAALPAVAPATTHDVIDALEKENKSVQVENVHTKKEVTTHLIVTEQSQNKSSSNPNQSFSSDSNLNIRIANVTTEIAKTTTTHMYVSEVSESNTKA